MPGINDGVLSHGNQLHQVNIWAGHPGHLTAFQVLFVFQFILEAVRCEAGGSRQYPLKTITVESY